jgi:hypothetical protein
MGKSHISTIESDQVGALWTPDLEDSRSSEFSHEQNALSVCMSDAPAVLPSSSSFFASNLLGINAPQTCGIAAGTMSSSLSLENLGLVEVLRCHHASCEATFRGNHRREILIGTVDYTTNHMEANHILAKPTTATDFSSDKTLV